METKLVINTDIIETSCVLKKVKKILINGVKLIIMLNYI